MLKLELSQVVTGCPVACLKNNPVMKSRKKIKNIFQYFSVLLVEDILILNRFKAFGADSHFSPDKDINFLLNHLSEEFLFVR